MFVINIIMKIFEGGILLKVFRFVYLKVLMDIMIIRLVRVVMGSFFINLVLNMINISSIMEVMMFESWVCVFVDMLIRF